MSTASVEDNGTRYRKYWEKKYCQLRVVISATYHLPCGTNYRHFSNKNIIIIKDSSKMYIRKKKNDHSKRTWDTKWIVIF